MQMRMLGDLSPVTLLMRKPFYSHVDLVNLKTGECPQNCSLRYVVLRSSFLTGPVWFPSFTLFAHSTQLIL